MIHIRCAGLGVVVQGKKGSYLGSTAQFPCTSVKVRVTVRAGGKTKAGLSSPGNKSAASIVHGAAENRVEPAWAFFYLLVDMELVTKRALQKSPSLPRATGAASDMDCGDCAAECATVPVTQAQNQKFEANKGDQRGPTLTFPLLEQQNPPPSESRRQRS